MSEIVFFLEERSAEAMLDGLLPRLLPPEIHHRCVVFEGKQDLERQMVRRMRGYRTPESRFLVLRDQDAGDCSIIKATLKAKCDEAGHPGAVVRIACRDLERWYLADLAAVERGLTVTGIQQLQNRRTYRAPDATMTPSRVLTRIVPQYQKIAGSRAIGPHLDLSNRRSRSFAHFVAAVRRIAGDMGR